VFSPSDVSAELAAFSAVWGQYSDAMSAGTLDLDANLPDIVARFGAAGQDKIVKEAQKQLDAFFAGK
jgi:putative aldouronate transport system substrate-binding protein